MEVSAWIRVTKTFPVVLSAAAALALASCGKSNGVASAGTTTTSLPATTAVLPGTGKPTVTIGDKNYTEQFVLGELYDQALAAQGFSVQLNRNIGPTEVTIQALENGQLDMYPEYLNTWNTAVAGDPLSFRSSRAAYQGGQQYALAHGLQLLDPTPFSDTAAIGVTVPFAQQNGLQAIGDLRNLSAPLTLGAPPQFQQSPAGLPGIEQVYGVVPGTFKPLGVGDQYQALDQGTVQAADVNTTDGQLVSGKYRLLRDPAKVFGWGNVAPVVSAKVLAAEGPAFAITINQVSALLSTPVMRQLNAAVDVFHQDPAAVAKQFLQAHGLVPAIHS